jgi:hypothetical protein
MVPEKVEMQAMDDDDYEDDQYVGMREISEDEDDDTC